MSSRSFLKRSKSLWLGPASAALVTIAAMPTASLSAQESPTFIDRVDVKVVNVETVVTDKHGGRVFGLAPGDFSLRVDGVPVPIDFFTEVRGGDVLRDVGQAPGVRPVAAGQARGTSYLVFVDDFFSITTDRQQVLDALVDELAYLGQADRMAIVAWDGRGLEMLSSWSNDERELRRAFQHAATRPALGLHRLAEEHQVHFGGTPGYRSRGAFGGRLNIEERAYAARLTEQVEGTVAAASSTLRAFAEPPGRKVMLLVSGGWPFSPANAVAGNAFALAYESESRGGSDLYRPLVETANLLGYSLYPVDAAGLERTSGIDASFASPRTTQLGDLQFYREWEHHTSLQFLAETTGGQALLDGQRGRPLELVYEDTRSFYWLGFVPQRAWDDGQHEIEIVVTRPGLEARSRTGFTDLSRSQEVAMTIESALLFGHAASEGELAVELGLPYKKGWGKVEVPLTLLIPADAVALLPIGEGEVGARLELRVAVMDSRGHRSEIPNVQIEVRRRTSDKDGTIVYETALRMRDRSHEMVIAVYDPATGGLLSTRAAITL